MNSLSDSRVVQDSWSPRAVVESQTLGDRKIWIVRDDFLPGGTKQRAIVPFLQFLASQGLTQFVYASPFCGFAQLALAISCHKLGYQCHIVSTLAPDSEGLPPLARIAESYGATLSTASSLTAAQDVAEAFALQDKTRYVIPLGFDCDAFREFMMVAFERDWSGICAKLGFAPSAL